MSSIYPEYPAELISLVRLIDRADCAFRVTNSDYSNVQFDSPRLYQKSYEHSHMFLHALNSSVIAARALLLTLVKHYSPGVLIEARQNGDAELPVCWQPVFIGIQECSMISVPKPSHEALIHALDEVGISNLAPGQRVILSDNEAYLVPADLPDSFIEMWWRRSMTWTPGSGFSDDPGSAYHVYMESRAYGWQVYAVER